MMKNGVIKKCKPSAISGVWIFGIKQSKAFVYSGRALFATNRTDRSGGNKLGIGANYFFFS